MTINKTTGMQCFMSCERCKCALPLVGHVYTTQRFFPTLYLMSPPSFLTRPIRNTRRFNTQSILWYHINLAILYQTSISNSLEIFSNFAVIVLHYDKKVNINHI